MNKLINSGYAKAAAVAGIMVAILTGTTAAFADGSDPVTTAFSTGQTNLTGYITTGIGVIVAVLLLGLGVGLLVKYLRKAVRAA